MSLYFCVMWIREVLNHCNAPIRQKNFCAVSVLYRIRIRLGYGTDTADTYQIRKKRIGWLCCVVDSLDTVNDTFQIRMRGIFDNFWLTKNWKPHLILSRSLLSVCDFVRLLGCSPLWSVLLLSTLFFCSTCCHAYCLLA